MYKVVYDSQEHVTLGVKCNFLDVVICKRLNGEKNVVKKI